MRSLRVSASKQLRAVFLFGIFVTTISIARPSTAEQPPSPAASRPLITQPLITQPINELQLTTLRGNTHPLARPQFDLGTAPATLPMQRMLLVLKRSPQQESALEKLLNDQQDKSSPNYHKWLTPEEYGKQFGPTDADLQTITAWLQSHGFQVGSTKGRTVLEFSGSASQVQEAFHTTIHKYIVNGEQHWANASDPQIPTALTPAVAGVTSLNNFSRKAMNHFVGSFSRDKSTGRVRPLTPLFTFSGQCTSDNYCFALGPYDFATIYNVLPLWNANINGTGQTIAIVAESNINPQDVASFRSLFDLPPNSASTGNPLNIILNGPDPGLQPDESEADIDVQWSGAVAPNAAIDFVVSQSTETTSGVDLSAVYIIDNNLAPVMSESYGLCELGLGTTGNQFYNTLWQQAAAQGITVFIAAGDNGSAGCDNFDAQSPAPAQFGLEVSGYASTPYNVAVGGTDFNDITNPETYWSTTNNSLTQASALGYIPETTWNSSCTNAAFITLGYDSTTEEVCNDSRVTPYWVVPLGGSGGASSCTTPNGDTPANCAGGYTKPSWQTGTGVPNDGKRDLPDVALFASSGFSGSFYIACQSDQTGGSCNLSDLQFLGFGGTSVSSPAFAGIMALVNQQTGSRQGNANYVLYKLAAKDTLSRCNSTASPASTCIFNDITMGTNAMPCVKDSPNCTTSAGDNYGVLTSYNAGTGYDQATGLGSVNANNLVTQWSSVTFLPSTTTLNSLTPTTITHGQPVNFSVTVSPQSGTGIPTGEISLQGGAGGTTPASTAVSLSNGTVSGTTNLLPAGTYSVTAHYPGDDTYAASNSSPISVTVSKENSTVILGGVILSGSATSVKTFPFDSQYFVRADVGNSHGSLCSPPPFGQVACPSGGVIFTVDGTQTNFNTFPLNSEGYTETWVGALGGLTGGTHTLGGQYSGDNNYNAGSGTVQVTVTKAATTTTPVTAQGAITQPVTLTTNVEDPTAYYGLATTPTGTVTFYSNGTAIPGTPLLTMGSNGSTLYTVATLTTTFSASGTYTLTASYSGDQNYQPSASIASQVTLQYPQPTVSATPPSQTVASGSTVTVTVLVDTGLKKKSPTGTVTLGNSDIGTLPGPASCTQTTDSSGNFACQATFTFTPPPASVSSADFFSAQYSGDANYPSSQSALDWIYLTDFSLSPGAGTVLVAEGQSQQVTVNVSAVNAFNGTVSNFSCSGLPAETQCSFNPTSVASNGSTILTINTTPLGQSRRPIAASHSIWWGAPGGALLLGICLIGIPSLKRPGSKLPALMMFVLFMALPGCGGGSGGGTVTNNPSPSISSLSPAQLAAGSGSQTLTINGSGFINTSGVTFNGLSHNATLISSTALSIQLTPADIASTGTFPVVVNNPAPGGGSSGTVNFDVVTGTPTGNFTVTVSASSGALTHNTSFTLQVH